MFNDKVSTYDRCGYTTVHIRRIKTITNEVFKSVHDLNPTFMKEMFNTKEILYDDIKLTSCLKNSGAGLPNLRFRLC